MFIGGVAKVWNNPKEEELFYQEYGQTDIHLELMSYYQQERIIEDIPQYIQALIMTSGSDNRELMIRHFSDMFAPNGVVDFALRTDKQLGYHRNT